MAALLPASARAQDGDARPFRLAMLSGHNDERIRLGVPPLRWNGDLAMDAQRRAADLARSGLLRHAAASHAKPAGENLWIGTHGAYGYGDMINAFLRERHVYVPGAMPRISATGNWADAAHYSQMIWRATTMVGCGFATGEAFDVLVCRYDPAGNVRGQRADQPAPGNGDGRMQIALAPDERPSGF